MKDRKLLSDATSTAKELVTLKFSPKRETIHSSVKDNIEEDDSEDEKPAGVLKLCLTRWMVMAACYNCIIANYSSLLEVWKVCLEMRVEPCVIA